MAAQQRHKVSIVVVYIDMAVGSSVFVVLAATGKHLALEAKPRYHSLREPPTHARLCV